MHLLASTSASIDDLVKAVDLRQSPGDIVILSFADSDLSGLAAAWAAQRDVLPTVRLANLRDLRHPLSVDVWLDTVGRHAKVVVVRLLGGLDWWRYGVERLSSLARASSIALAVLPGEDRDDPRLAEASTLPTHELNTLLRFFREGGGENLGALLLRLARHSGVCLEAPEPRPVPRTAGYIPGEGAVDLDRLVSFCQRGRPCVPIIFYRAMLLAADTAPIDALCRALAERGLEPAPLVVSSLKDRAAAEFVRAALTRLKPAVIVTATAFAATTGAGEPTSRCTSCCPNSTGACCKAWSLSKGHCRHRTTSASAHSAVCRRQTGSRSWPIASRRWSSFRPHRAPSGAWRCCCPTTQARWAGPGMPSASMFRRALLDALAEPSNDAALPLDRYRDLVATLPVEAIARVQTAWGAAGNDSDVRDGAFCFRARTFGNILVAFPPDRGRSTDRRADYHDATLPPRHALLAFGLWLRHVAKVDALVHMGAHGTLEWLPGKAVALTGSCFPELMVACLPVIYPFIVSNPGEAAQAKRRIAAVTIGHLPPPLVDAGLAGDARELERLIDEYAQADGLDRRRRERLARLILEQAERTGLAVEARVQPDDGPDDALRRIDAWLCDLKDRAVKDGLHVYGREPMDVGDPAWRASAEAERVAILAALDVRRIAPGPAGSPARGRRDVLPTGRNMFAADPRTLPTPTATDLGRLAADEVIRVYVQTHGEMPRASVVDLWGSATLRTGGEEIAQ